jgi:zinc protease
MLGALVSGSRTRRLTKALVYDRQSAAQAFGGQGANEDVGTFIVTIIPRPGHSLTELELATDSVFERLKKEGPTTEELEKAKAGFELSTIGRFESQLGKAETLAQGSVFFNDPNYYRTNVEKTLAVTAADVKRVAAKYLTSGRVILSVVPMGKVDQAAKPEASVKVGAASTTSSRTEAR